MKTPLARSFFLFLLALMAGGTVAAAAPASSDKLVAEGQTSLSQGLMDDALLSFRQAAKAGNVNGALAAGDLLLGQARKLTGRDRIQKSFDALSYLYFAATNLNARACADLSVAYYSGIGVQTNLVEAYSWLDLAARLEPSFRPELDQLVVQLDPDEIRQAQATADAYQHGRWPMSAIRPVELTDARLRIQGLTSSNRGPLVVVNGKTFAQGDTDSILPANSSNHPDADKLAITCVEIGSDYVLLAVGGEPAPKLLSTRQFVAN